LGRYGTAGYRLPICWLTRGRFVRQGVALQHLLLEFVLIWRYLDCGVLRIRGGRLRGHSVFVEDSSFWIRQWIERRYDHFTVFIGCLSCAVKGLDLGVLCRFRCIWFPERMERLRLTERIYYLFFWDMGCCAVDRSDSMIEVLVGLRLPQCRKIGNQGPGRILACYPRKQRSLSISVSTLTNFAHIAAFDPVDCC
jgi:hypothetical protein